MLLGMNADFKDMLTALHGKLGSDQAVLDALREAAPGLEWKKTYRQTLAKMRWGDVKEPSYSIGCAIVSLYERLKNAEN